MVILSLSSRFNKLAGPFLLRRGLSARYTLGGRVIRDNPTLDAFLLLPLAQKLISLEVQDEAIQAIKQARKEPSSLDKFVDRTFDSLFGKDPDEEQKKAQEEEEVAPSTTRLKALEQYLRPVLVPNERWSDVIRWQFHNRFLKWARVEFLVAKHGFALKQALQKNQKLRIRLSPLLSPTKVTILSNILRRGGRLSNDEVGERVVLPSAAMVKKAFHMEKWKRKKDLDADWRRMTEIAKQLGGHVTAIPNTSLRVAVVSPEADLSELSLEDLLEVTGGHMASCGAFNVLCEEGGIFELWTKDYLSALASYLLHQSERFKGDTLVLDVGAGDGLLAHFLREFLEIEAKRQFRSSQGHAPSYGRRRTRRRATRHIPIDYRSKLPHVVATDNGSWRIEAKAPVERLSVQDAIAKYSKKEQQLIVLCSWMPMGEDWTSVFRAGGADEYILIGECDDGNCGDNWATWGNYDYYPEQAEVATNDEGDPIAIEKPSIPYVLEGYKRSDLDDLSLHQFSRFDCSESCNSRTVSFRRIGP